jgi:ribose transport system substrate-binding protein
MKKFLTLLPAILLSTWLGCSGKQEESTGPQNAGVNGENADKPKGIIAYTPQTLSNPFFGVIGDHIRAEAEQNGYEVLIVDPDYDVKKQSDQFDDFIAKNVTAIVLVPCDRISVGPAVQAANKAGIPVFTVDAKCAAEGVKIEGHVGTDNFQGGELAGKAMVDALGDKGGKVLILDLKRAHSCVLRVEGFKKVINAHNKEATGKIEIVSELDGNGDRTKGYQSTADALQAHSDLDAIFAINDPSALGAYTAVKEAKREDKIKIIGFDGQLDGKQAIKDGKIYGDPIQHPDKMGKLIVQLVVKYQAGEEIQPETLIPATLYTKAEADQDPDLK